MYNNYSFKIAGYTTLPLTPLLFSLWLENSSSVDSIFIVSKLQHTHTTINAHINITQEHTQIRAHTNAQTHRVP